MSSSRRLPLRIQKAGRLAATWQNLSQSLQLTCRASERYITQFMPGPKLSGHSSSWPLKKGRYFADLFSGCGRVASAARALGFRNGRLKRDANSISLTQECSSSWSMTLNIKKCSVAWAPPCLSFSRARDRAGVIRTALHPWGLRGLSSREQEKANEKNGCMKSALKIICWLDSEGPNVALGGRLNAEWA